MRRSKARSTIALEASAGSLPRSTLRRRRPKRLRSGWKPKSPAPSHKQSPHFPGWTPQIRRAGWRQTTCSPSGRSGAICLHNDVLRLEKAITDFLAVRNEHPRPFVWTAVVESIKEKLSRCHQTLEQIQPGCTLPRGGKSRKTFALLILRHYTRLGFGNPGPEC